VDVAGEDVDDLGVAQDEIGWLQSAGDTDPAAEGFAARRALIRKERRGNLLPTEAFRSYQFETQGDALSRRIRSPATEG
jgi:hypothetical protein